MPFGMYGQLYDKYGVQWIFKGDLKKQERALVLRSSAFFMN